MHVCVLYPGSESLAQSVECSLVFGANAHVAIRYWIILHDTQISCLRCMVCESMTWRTWIRGVFGNETATLA